MTELAAAASAFRMADVNMQSYSVFVLTLRVIAEDASAYSLPGFVTYDPIEWFSSVATSHTHRVAVMSGKWE